MNIFIIGATGYVGSAVARAAIAAGYRVTGLGHAEESQQAMQEAGIEPVEGDLNQPSGLESAVSAADAVVYGASSDADADAIPLLLEWMKGTSKPFALVGGSSTYGDTGDGPLSADADFNPPQPLADRAELEKQVLNAEDVRTAVVYSSFVYGHSGGAIPQMMLGKMRDESTAYYINDGSNKWSSAHVDDFASLVLRVLETESASGKFVAAANAYTIREIVQAMADAVGVEDVRSVDLEKAQDVYGFFAGPLTMNQWYSADKAESIGWRPQQPDLMRYLQGIGGN